MSTSIQNKAKFDRIRYANCWEDADILLKALDIKPSDRVLSVASGGDNSFSLLAAGAQKVTAVDINPTQLYLVELKMAAFRKLNHAQTAAFLGFTEDINRLNTYKQQLKNELGPEAQTYWDEKMDTIQNGVIYSGKFENYFAIYRKWVQPLMVSRKETALFFAGPPTREFIKKNNQKMSRPFIKKLYKLFFSKTIMGFLGRSPAFFEQVDIHVGQYVYERTRRALTHPESYRNGYLRFIAQGTFAENLPHYMRPENFEPIKQNLHKFELKQVSIEGALKSERYNKLNLSNIFEYMDGIDFSKFAQLLAENSEKGTKLACWNLMVDRRLSTARPAAFMLHKQLSKELSAEDRLFFYKQFNLEENI